MPEEDKMTRLKEYGDYQTSTHSFFDSKEYKDLKEPLIKDLPNNIPLNLPLYDLDDVLKAGKQIIKSHTNSTNTEVLYTNNDHLYSKIIKEFGLVPKQDDYKDIIKYMKENSSTIDITSVPVELDIEKDENGYIKNAIPYLNLNLDPAFFKNMPYVITCLKLRGMCSNITISSYVHEMYHALIDRNKGSVQNMLNMEMLPIFMEYVATLDLDHTMNINNLRTSLRLIETKMEIKYLESQKPHSPFGDVIAKGYILSTLEATALFETYQKGKAQIKTEIDNDVNRVITGDTTLEDLIQKYEATPEQGSKIIKRQIKKLF